MICTKRWDYHGHDFCRAVHLSVNIWVSRWQFLSLCCFWIDADSLPSPKSQKSHSCVLLPLVVAAREENVATFRGSEYFCYDLSQNPIQSSSDEITLSFKTWQRNGLLLHTGKSADYVNLALKDGAVSLVINLGSGAFEAIVEPVNGKFNDNAWHDIKVTRNLRQVIGTGGDGRSPESHFFFFLLISVFILFSNLSFFRSAAFEKLFNRRRERDRDN